MPFYSFEKAHKFFSMRHLTLKGAPMCAYAHTIEHSGSIGNKFSIIMTGFAYSLNCEFEQSNLATFVYQNGDF